MCAAQSFSFGEYNRDFNPRQKYVIRSLVEASLAWVIEEVRYWHVEEELDLWSACEKGSCLPTRFEDGRWKDRLAEKWGLLIQVAAEIATVARPGVLW